MALDQSLGTGGCLCPRNLGYIACMINDLDERAQTAAF